MNTAATEPALPPLHTRLNNARRATQRVITRVMKAGSITVPADCLRQRMEICHQCEFYRKSDGTCSKCGCFIRLKANLTTEACPVDRWAGEAAEKPDAPVVLNGSALLDAELELRELFPPETGLIQLLNQFHIDVHRGGCVSLSLIHI